MMFHIRYKDSAELGCGFPLSLKASLREPQRESLTMTTSRCLGETVHLSWLLRRRRRRWQEEYKGSFFSELGSELRPM